MLSVVHKRTDCRLGCCVAAAAAAAAFLAALLRVFGLNAARSAYTRQNVYPKCLYVHTIIIILCRALLFRA